METITLGSTVLLIDPCYTPTVWCKTVLDDVLPGEYVGDIVKTETGSPSMLFVKHKDYGLFVPDKFVGHIGVDSGQAGIFDYEYFDSVGNMEAEACDKWYKQICEGNFHPDDKDNTFTCYNTDGKGVVSNTKDGDGMYSCYVARNSEQKIVAIVIKF